MQGNFTQSSQQLTVLVVDDSPTSIHVIGEAIKSLAKVLVAGNGSLALSLVKRERPDLILLDIQMPNLNGLEVCRAIKSDPETFDTQIIFVTGQTNPSTELEALGLGGIDFISKPINSAILRTRVKAQLTAIKRTKELISARSELHRLLATLPVFVSHWSCDLVNTFCNDIEGKWFGFKPHELSELFISTLFLPEEYSRIESNIERVKQGENSVVEVTLSPPRGAKRYAQLSFIANQAFNNVDGFVLVITDVTDRKTGEIQLTRDKDLADVTLRSIGDGVIATDVNGKITFINPVAEEMTGYVNNSAVGKNIEDVMIIHDAFTHEKVINPIRTALKEDRVVEMPLDTTLLTKQKEVLYIEDSAAPIHDKVGHLIGAILVFHDVSAAKAESERIVKMATHDSLTGLPNRALLLDRTAQAIKQAQFDNSHCCLLMIDVDDFESINNLHGYLAGDALMAQIAARLQEFAEPNVTLSRPNGDEFVVLLNDITDLSLVSQYCTNLLEAMEQAWTVEGTQINLTVSIGVAVYPNDTDDAYVLYRRADTAMRECKRKGKNHFRFFSNEIEARLASEFKDEKALRQAIESHELEVYYQPKIDGLTNKMVGAEALLRWPQNDGSIRFPDAFIGLAESTKLIIPLGKQVLYTACKQLREWQLTQPDMSLSVNISAIQFKPSLVATVSAVLADVEIPAHSLELEITESVLINDAHAIDTFMQLKALGVKISLDDFGKGFSSLSYIKEYPIDVLKIDQSFVRKMLNNHTDTCICRTIISLAACLGLDLVAEGVETDAHANKLIEMGCTRFQGYLYSKPITASEITERFLNRIQVK
ncbi:EAL domain-containing protein [Glaciecola siphonariae]|uniref:EAL domain-containing protein n=1 Tax=Glaciecola siphonariae TaxID=521012 RepID=A0ABV9LUY5_9ALTE